jgi:hypothetical protein
VIALALRWAIGSKAPAFQAGVWVAAAGSAGFICWLTYSFSRESQYPGFTTSGLVIVAWPLAAAGAAVVAFAYGWGLATAVVEARRLSAGSTGPGGALARSAGPAVLVVAVTLFLYFQDRPTTAGQATTKPAAATTQPGPASEPERDRSDGGPGDA